MTEEMTVDLSKLILIMIQNNDFIQIKQFIAARIHMLVLK